jgi:hypothetical protein
MNVTTAPVLVADPASNGFILLSAGVGFFRASFQALSSLRSLSSS